MDFHPSGQENRHYTARTALALATVKRLLDDLHQDGGRGAHEFDGIYRATGYLELTAECLRMAVDELGDVETVRNLQNWQAEKVRLAEVQAARLIRRKQQQVERRLRAAERAEWEAAETAAAAEGETVQTSVKSGAAASWRGHGA